MELIYCRQNASRRSTPNITNVIRWCGLSSKVSKTIVRPSDTYPHGVWGSFEGASEGLNTRRPPLLWVAWACGGLNQTRPDLASSPSLAARNQSETRSLFRAPWLLQSASGTTAFLVTLRSWRDRDRQRNLKDTSIIWKHHFKYYLGQKVIIWCNTHSKLI